MRTGPATFTLGAWAAAADRPGFDARFAGERVVFKKGLYTFVASKKIYVLIEWLGGCIAIFVVLLVLFAVGSFIDWGSPW